MNSARGVVRGCGNSTFCKARPVLGALWRFLSPRGVLFRGSVSWLSVCDALQLTIIGSRQLMCAVSCGLSLAGLLGTVPPMHAPH